MPKSKVTVPHTLGKEEALNRLTGLLAQAKAQYGDRITDLHENWTDNGGTFSFKAMNFKISGSVDVSDTNVEINGEYPWAVKPFQGTIEATLRERAERLLA